MNSGSSRLPERRDRTKWSYSSPASSAEQTVSPHHQQRRRYRSSRTRRAHVQLGTHLERPSAPTIHILTQYVASPRARRRQVHAPYTVASPGAAGDYPTQMLVLEPGAGNYPTQLLVLEPGARALASNSTHAGRASDTPRSTARGRRAGRALFDCYMLLNMLATYGTSMYFLAFW